MQATIDFVSWLMAWAVVVVGALVVFSMILAVGYWLIDHFTYRKKGQHCWWFIAYAMWNMRKGRLAKEALRLAIEADECNKRKDPHA